MAEREEARLVGGTGGDIAYLQYTSGSTGTPLGVAITHENVLSNLADIDRDFCHNRTDTSVTWLPHYHDMGLVYGVIQPVYNGFRCVAMAPAAFSQRPIRWLQAISDWSATHSGGPNFAYDLCTARINADETRRLNLSSWRVAFNGAEPVRARTLERFVDKFRACGFRRTSFYPAYGLAEATLKVSGGFQPADGQTLEISDFELQPTQQARAVSEGERKLQVVPCGFVTEHVLIVDPHNAVRRQSSVIGEIWVSGASVGKGYWNNQEDTERVFRGRLATGEGPFLRTGDLGFVRDGSLFVTGRLKDLIILRGRNIYPQDLECTALEAHPALNRSVAACFSMDLDEQTVGLVVEYRSGRNPDVDQVAQAIRCAISKEHEVHVKSIVLVKVGEIPRTSSGKIRRALTKDLLRAGKLHEIGRSVLSGLPGERGAVVAADVRQGEILQKIAQILEIEAQLVSRTVPLSQYGLDSLAAMEIQELLRREYSRTVPLETLFEAEGVDGILRSIESATEPALGPTEKVSPMEVSGSHGTYLLSYEQERFRVLSHLFVGTRSLEIYSAIHIKGPLRVGRLQSALNQIATRHPALRTHIIEKDGTGLQQIDPHETPWLSVVDVSGLNGRKRQEILEISACSDGVPECSMSFPWRFRLFRLSTSEHLLSVIAHHIVADAWSMQIIFKELATAYEKGLENSGPMALHTFVDWQRIRSKTDATEQEKCNFWRSQLNSAACLALPFEPARTDGRVSVGFATERAELPEELMRRLRAFAQRQQATLFMTMLAAWKGLLARISDAVDISVAAPFHGRLLPEIADSIGCFAYPLVMRTSVAGDPAPTELLRRVRSTVLKAFAHRDVPSGRVSELLNSESTVRNAKTRTLFNLLKTKNAIEQHDLVWQMEAPDRGVPGYDLSLSVFEREGVATIVASCDRTKVPDAALSSVLLGYRAMLEAMLSQPEAPLSSVPIHITSHTQDAFSLRIGATFTAETLEPPLRFWMRELGWNASLDFAPVHSVLQQLLDPQSRFVSNARGANVVLFRFEDAGNVGAEEFAEELACALLTAASVSRVPILVFTCTLPGDEVDAARLLDLERLLSSRLQHVNNVHFDQLQRILDLYEVRDVSDPYSQREALIPFGPAAMAALATAIARTISGLSRPPIKMIVVDCDNTLWRGSCGEDGAKGVGIDEGCRTLQRFLAEQSTAGVLVCLCSKNEGTDVRNVFDTRNEMVLRQEHVSDMQVNWLSKSSNVRLLAKKFNVSLDSILVLDDNPLECAEVSAACPEVTTLQVPTEPTELCRFTRHLWILDRQHTTDEDRRRIQMYREDARREESRLTKRGYRDFIAGLNLTVSFRTAAPEMFARAAQLTQRTNQFNVTCIRHNEREIASIVGSGERTFTVVDVQDRFGSYGSVGLMGSRPTDDGLEVDTFLLSCRALERGVEYQMLSHLGSVARANACSLVRVRFVATGRNKPAYEFLERTGAQFRRTVRHETFYDYPVAFATDLNHRALDWLTKGSESTIEPGDAEHSASTAAVLKQNCEAPFQKIATRLNTGEAVLRAMRGLSGCEVETDREAEHLAVVPIATADVEQTVAEIWSEVLGQDDIHRDQNLFDLGAQSIVMLQIGSRIGSAFGVNVPLNSLLENPTITGLAGLVSERLARVDRGSRLETALELIEKLGEEEISTMLKITDPDPH
jgi:FkbH-like protein